MGKYESGVSMKTVIKDEVGNVNRILVNKNVPDKDRNAVIDAIKEMAYQWCASNASACAVEQAVKNVCGNEKYEETVKASIRNGVMEQKMLETYPY